MKTTILAAAAVAMGVAGFGAPLVHAKGPVSIEQGASPLILIKETPTTIDMADFPFGLEEGRSENVRMVFEPKMPAGDSGDTPVSLKYTITFPWIDVEKDGDDKVTISMDEQIVEVSVGDGSGDASMPDMAFNGAITYDNMSSTFERDGDRMDFTATADGFAMTMEPPKELAEEGMSMDYQIKGGAISMEGNAAADQDWTDISTIDVSYDYTLESMDMDMKMSGPDGEAMDMMMTFGESTATGLIRDGRMEMSSDMNDMTLQMANPMPIDASMELVSVAMGMPTEPAPKPQPIKYKIDFKGITMNDEVWAMADPGEAFPRNLDRLTIDFEMMALMMVSLFDPEGMAEAEASGMPPMMPTSAKINSIAFDGLGLKVDATGEGELNGAIPSGTAFVSVIGLSEFVASAMQAGFFGEQEAMMIEGMAGQLGKEGDSANELVFDIKTEGAMLNVNGAPVMPLPGAQ